MMNRFAGLVCTTVMVSLVAACSSVPPPATSAAEVPETRPGSGTLIGYLPRKDLPNSLALLPPPPAPNSALAAADEDAWRAVKPLRGSARWTLASADANLKFPKAAQTFSCAMDMPISQEATPHLNMLLRRTLVDAGLSTYAAKDKYNRTRPFAAHKDSPCTPQDEAQLSKDGSYPSGHAALGWAWALLLSELAPERTDALLARGHAFGQSRVICGVHWQSDVDAGRLMGSAAVAKLHADPVFKAQMAAARSEVVAARSKGAKPGLDCQAEAAALK